MSGIIWKFSQYMDDEDVMFSRKCMVSYRMAQDYYGLGMKSIIRMAWASGAVYKIGKKVLIRRDIFEEYLRQHQKIVEDLIDGDEDKLLQALAKEVEGESYE